MTCTADPWPNWILTWNQPHIEQWQTRDQARLSKDLRSDKDQVKLQKIPSFRFKLFSIDPQQQEQSHRRKFRFQNFLPWPCRWVGWRRWRASRRRLHWRRASRCSRLRSSPLRPPSRLDRENQRERKAIGRRNLGEFGEGGQREWAQRIYIRQRTPRSQVKWASPNGLGRCNAYFSSAWRQCVAGLAAFESEAEAGLKRPSFTPKNHVIVNTLHLSFLNRAISIHYKFNI